MNNFTFIDGGVTAPQGFVAAGVCAGVKQATSDVITKAEVACFTPEIGRAHV